MTEKELRKMIVDKAASWLGYSEADGRYRSIIDIYNSHKPLARGYKVKYTDEWCATFVSAVFIDASLVDLIPTECGCQEMIDRFKSSAYPGAWIESDIYTPTPGDIIMYHWQTGTGANTGRANHTGIVAGVHGDMYVVIEGNYSEAVRTRTISADDTNIRGFAIPSYKEHAEAPISDGKYIVTNPPIMIINDLAEAVNMADDMELTVYDETGKQLYTHKDTTCYEVTTALRLRAGPGTSYISLATMPKGTKVCDLGESKEVSGTKWLCVKYGMLEGWASSTYLRILK